MLMTTASILIKNIEEAGGDCVQLKRIQSYNYTNHSKKSNCK